MTTVRIWLPDPDHSRPEAYDVPLPPAWARPSVTGYQPGDQVLVCLCPHTGAPSWHTLDRAQDDPGSLLVIRSSTAEQTCARCRMRPVRTGFHSCLQCRVTRVRCGVPWLTAQWVEAGAGV